MKLSDVVKRSLLALFIGSIIALIIYGYIIRSDTKTNGTFTVGKYIIHKKLGKHQTNTFAYFRDGQKVYGDGGPAPKDYSNKIEKFYQIRYSTTYSNSVIADYSNEIKDSAAIVKAGFSPDELEYE